MWSMEAAPQKSARPNVEAANCSRAVCMKQVGLMNREIPESFRVLIPERQY